MLNHFRYLKVFAFSCLLSVGGQSAIAQDFDVPQTDYAWSFDEILSDDLLRKGHQLSFAEGVHGRSAIFNGRGLLEVEDSGQMVDSTQPFSLIVWFNPYDLQRGQQMIVAKNRYSLNEREWGVMVDRDRKLRLYVHQSKWKTVHAEADLKIGHWHQLALIFHDNRVALWLNGEIAGEVQLSQPIPKTNASMTFGGVDDNGRIWQNFVGAIDDALLIKRALSPKEIKELYQPVIQTHRIPDEFSPLEIWDRSVNLPTAQQASVLKGVTFRVIKNWDQGGDGYTFLHGVNLCWHQGQLFASIGHNKGKENTVSEEAQYRVSDDHGDTWSELQVIDAGDEENLAISHGVFLSHRGKLWAFHGAYFNKMENIHTRAYSLNEESGMWTQHGTVLYFKRLRMSGCRRVGSYG